MTTPGPVPAHRQGTAASLVADTPRAAPVHPVSSRVVPVAFVVIGLGALLPVALTSTTASAVMLGVAAFFGVLFTFGLTNTGASLCVAGVATAPFTAVVIPGAPFVTVSDLLFMIGFGILVPGLLTRPLPAPWTMMVGSLVFFAAGCLSSLGAADTSLSFSVLLRIVAANAVLPLLFLWWAPRGRLLVVLAFAYPVGMVVNVGYAFIEGPLALNGRYDGLAEQPTGFGFSALLAACLLPFVAAMLPEGRRWLVWATLPVLLYGVWISGSRASVLVLLLLLLVAPLRERSVKVIGLVALAGVVLFAMFPKLASAEGSNAVARLFGGEGADYSTDARFEGLFDVLKEFVSHPIIGGGLDQSFEAHNLYVQLLAMTGIVGFVGFMLVLWAFVVPLFKGPAPYYLLGYPALAYVIAGPITPNLTSRYVTVVLALSLVVWGVERSRTGEDPAHAETREPVRFH